MTMRERMLAWVQGRPHDRVPFVEYTGIAGVPNDEVWSVLGRENLGILQWCSVHRLEAPSCRFETEPIAIGGRAGKRTTLSTPNGTLTDERLDAAIATSSYKHYIREPEDYRVFLSYLRDVTVVPDTVAWERIYRDLGDDGLPHTSLGRSPFQQLWIQWVSIEDLILHMADYPDLLDEVFAEMFRIQHDVFTVVSRVIEKLPVPYVNFPDNITAPVIGERFFRTYCLRSYLEFAEVLEASGRVVPISAHMDGDLKPLWGAISESPVRLLDSMSPPPDNDTSVADALALAEDLRVGINFPSSVHLLSDDEIYEHTIEILEQGGRSGRLQIQISENMPPGTWRKSYPAIVRAIRDFAPVAAG